MIGKYTQQELKPDWTHEEAEHLRLQNILTDLLQRTADVEILSEIEKDFICSFLKTAQGDLPPFDVATVCAHYNFKFTYLIYFRDLTGGSAYYRPFGTEIRQIGIDEATSSLLHLKNEASNWEQKLADKSTKDKLVLEIIREYEYEIDQVQKGSSEYQSNFQFGGRRIYDAKKMSTVLQNKFIYLSAKEVFETFNVADLTFTLNGKQIVINEFSIVHITNRHFAEMVKAHPTTKSFHNESFHPKLLNKQLRAIFTQIENLGGIKKLTSLREIYFKYQNEVYKVYTTDRPNNKGEIFLSTFFILEDQNQLQKLTKDYDLINVSADLDFYQPK
ncbi:hypothetical protein HDE68_004852 [Pedobacter cryoconitis]|uniref:Uncharacterized protein n=1 Tax=Pedobacter cryoconitis TaxID=188932 RepID=A0A7W8ZRK9_9SPHI|nr:hypothetical protein [Pedobacter cryoconitis]MBB5638914.1 hypothetical protein [Pedobacter cryoconitis]